MKRLIGLARAGAIGGALVGAVCAVSCDSAAPPAPRDVSPKAVEAQPKTVTAPTRATAKVDAKEKVMAIVMPEVVIYGRVPHARVSPLAVPPPSRAAIARLYGRAPNAYDLYGLGLTGPGPVTPLEPRLVRASIAAEAPPGGPYTRAIAVSGDEPRPPALRLAGDPGLPRAVVREVMQSHVGALEVCYRTAARENRGLRGTADVSFVIGTNGHVEQVQVDAQGLGGSPVVDCISNAVSKLDFAPPAAPLHVHRRIDVGPGFDSPGA